MGGAAGWEPDPARTDGEGPDGGGRAGVCWDEQGLTFMIPLQVSTTPLDHTISDWSFAYILYFT